MYAGCKVEMAFHHVTFSTSRDKGYGHETGYFLIRSTFLVCQAGRSTVKKPLLQTFPT